MRYPFYIEDTPGLNLADSKTDIYDTKKTVSDGLEESDLILFVVDSLHGVTKDDH